MEICVCRNLPPIGKSVCFKLTSELEEERHEIVGELPRFQKREEDALGKGVQEAGRHWRDD